MRFKGGAPWQDWCPYQEKKREQSLPSVLLSLCLSPHHVRIRQENSPQPAGTEPVPGTEPAITPALDIPASSAVSPELLRGDPPGLRHCVGAAWTHHEAVNEARYLHTIAHIHSRTRNRMSELTPQEKPRPRRRAITPARVPVLPRCWLPPTQLSRNPAKH